MRYRKAGATAFALAAGLAAAGGGPAQAHGSGVVKTCIQGTDCTNDSSKTAVFAVCDPMVAVAYPCSHPSTNPDKQGPRPVTVQLSGFPASTNVYVWFLNSEVDDPSENDCTQAVPVGRTPLGVVASSTGGKASLNVSLPLGNHTQAWSYGANWICATTASAPGANGTVGDQQFAVYPA